MSDGISVGGVPKIGSAGPCPLTMRLGWLPKSSSLTTWVSMPHWTADVQTARAYVWRTHGKNWAPHIPPFRVSGYSWSPTL